jgi:peptidoglycan-associated lipoprotein
MDFPSVNCHERRTMKILLALLASVLLAGCAVVPMAPAPPAYYRYGPTYYYYPGRYYYYPGPYYDYPYYPFYGRPAPVPPPPPPPPSAAPPRPLAPPPPAPAAQPAPAAILRPIYFDLNESGIRPDAEKTLKENLEWFRQNPGRKVVIQGNCDPRASGEYNLVLGQRRADATKKYLVGLGVDVALLKTVSYGNERPSCEEKDESCWAKERRVDFRPMP